MQRRNFALIASLLVGLLLGSCASNNHSPRTKNLALAMAYDGPMPSAMAQKSLMKVRGQSFGAEQVSTGVGGWTVGRYAIIEDSQGDVQPTLILESGKKRIHVPILTDGDVQFIFEKVLMTESPVWGRGQSRQLTAKLGTLLK